ncbi:MAG: hypothetical protein U0836_17975 [Pirellulales bacterium]
MIRIQCNPPLMNALVEWAREWPTERLLHMAAACALHLDRRALDGSEKEAPWEDAFAEGEDSPRAVAWEQVWKSVTHCVDCYSEWHYETFGEGVPEESL